MAGPQPRSVPARYTNVELIAHGGMADVYRATDSVLERTVAVKVLAERYAADQDFRARFTREAQTAASLSHPNVVTIYDVGEIDGTPYIVMEHLGGGSLADRVREQRIAPAAALVWLSQAADALDAAHAAGIVHRDVKPGNLLLDREGDVHVSDFGIARAAAHDPLTSAGTILGSSGYMAPEQARGEPATPASDRYALGCVAFELLTGRRPFEAESPTAEAMLHASEPPPRPSEIEPALPAAADAAVLQALAKDPDSRPRSAAAFVEALGAAFAEPDDATRVLRADPQDRPTRSPRRGRRPVAVAAALVVLAGVGAAAGLALRGGDEPTAAATEPTAAATEPPAPSAPPPSPQPRTFASAAEANDRAYELMLAGDFDTALPMLEDAHERLSDTGTKAEAYTAYNLAYTRFTLGSCNGVLDLLDRSEAVQGERTEISRLRHRAEKSCNGRSDSSGDGDGDDDDG
jgi:serine/threonine-protein kinase